MRLSRALLAIALLFSAAGCGRRAASIDVSPKRLKIYGIGNTQRLTGRLLDKKGNPLEQGSVSWSSSKDDVASTDSSGLVTAKSEGKAILKARFEKLETQIPVEVLDVKMIEMTPPLLQLIGPPRTQFPLQAIAKTSKGKPAEQTFQWSSSKPRVATVDSRGVVTSMAGGTTTIVAKLGDLQAACDVAVILRELTRLELHPATAIVRVGDIQKFDVIGFGADGKPIEGVATVFQSSDPAVARVDAAGVATGVAAGTATIRASLGPLTTEATLLVN